MATDQPSPDIDHLLHEARRGSPAALQTLFECFSPFLLKAVRRRLRFPLRRLVDEVDVLQDVRIEFGAETVPLEALTSQRALLGHLCVRARNKLAETRRHYLEAQRRNLERDVPLQRVPAPNQPSPATPDQLAEREWLDRLEASLPALPQAIFRLMRQGQTHAAIAEFLKISERTVERHVRKLKSLPPPER